jgi:glycosyltransferase involved in cell wall biosynthesis
VFLSEPHQRTYPGVRCVYYAPELPAYPGLHNASRELEWALIRAKNVARMAENLKILGFTPDIIIGHQGWGELLNLVDVWQETPVLGYMEFYYNPHGADVGFDSEFPESPDMFGPIRARNAVNHLALAMAQTGQCPTIWQRDTYPEWARGRLVVLPEGVDLDKCSPDPSARLRQLSISGLEVEPQDTLVTFVARNLEPYRGFPTFMRSVPGLLRRPDVKIVIIGGDGVSYGFPPPTGGNWRETLLSELGDQLDLSRMCFAGQVPYETYLSVLQRSDAHVYLTYPFVASWSLREALAVGALVVGSDTPPVREFITHRKNGLLVPFDDPHALAETILSTLDAPQEAKRLRAAARKYAVSDLDIRVTLAGYDELIADLTRRR